MGATVSLSSGYNLESSGQTELEAKSGAGDLPEVWWLKTWPPSIWLSTPSVFGQRKGSGCALCSHLGSPLSIDVGSHPQKPPPQPGVNQGDGRQEEKARPGVPGGSKGGDLHERFAYFCPDLPCTILINMAVVNFQELDVFSFSKLLLYTR